ncbi:MAG: hypothetical protein JWN78_424 [Bacteroidota bacterium]|nr:hypothetical protein [Bacteroidota bacterium]
MKKVLVICISVSFIATGCNWFNHKPKSDDVVVTDDSLSTLVDTAIRKTDNTLVVPDSIKKTAGKKM